MRRIPFATAAYVLLVLFAGAMVFQLVVLAGFVPTEMVWGGRLSNEEERTIGAVVSIVVLMAFSLCVLLRTGRIAPSWTATSKWGMWAVCALLALNTLGNVFALDLRETLIFTPITLISAVLAARVAIGD